MEEHDSIIGKVISHYHVLSRIAVGGMGEVYLAHDNSLERSVALKILPARLASDEEHLLRFMREPDCVCPQSSKHHHDLRDRTRRAHALHRN